MIQGTKKKVWLSWSSGKDSAWALHALNGEPDVEVCGLLCTVNGEFDRVAMHGVRRSIVEQQAQSAGIPLVVAEIPFPCTNDIYQQIMASIVQDAHKQDVSAVAFGDLYLHDVRKYREDMMRGTGLDTWFPLWGIPTTELARTMVDAGLKARVVSLDPRRVPAALAGRDYDHEFLDQLPAEVDPCGENGEFHTLVTGGPMFLESIQMEPVGIVERDGYVYADFAGAVSTG